MKAIQPIAKGEEFFAKYGYSFDSAPVWYKDLFLHFMEQHPEEIEVIQRVSGGRTKEQLLEAYKKYMEMAPGTTMNDGTMGSTSTDDEESENKQDKTDQPSFNI